jgi:urease accessory protein UreE
VEWIEFGYRTSSKSTRDATDVHVSDYMISLPLFITYLTPGDILEIEDYDRTFEGQVLKKQSFNLGSNIWFNEVKN